MNFVAAAAVVVAAAAAEGWTALRATRQSKCSPAYLAMEAEDQQLLLLRREREKPWEMRQFGSVVLKEGEEEQESTWRGRLGT